MRLNTKNRRRRGKEKKLKRKINIRSRLVTAVPKINPSNAFGNTGRKLDAHDTFKRRPRCLLNVSYTFDLRSVSRWVCLRINILSL